MQKPVHYEIEIARLNPDDEAECTVTPSFEEALSIYEHERKQIMEIAFPDYEYITINIMCDDGRYLEEVSDDMPKYYF